MDFRALFSTKTPVAMAALLVSLTSAIVGLTGVPAEATAINNASSVDDIRWSDDFQPEHADVLRLYRAFFDREPDVDGAKYWIAQYNAGATFDEIAWVFANGAEFQARYGDTGNHRFLTIVYTNVLGRTYDQAGFNYWLDQLETGALTRSGVVRWIAASPEFRVRRPQAPAEYYVDTLLTQADMPMLKTQGWEATAPQPIGGCDDGVTAPYGALTSVWQPVNDNSGGREYVAFVVPFKTSAEASNYLNNELAIYYLNCGHGFGPLPATGLGDESLSVGYSVSDWNIEYHVVRQDNVVLGMYSAETTGTASRATTLVSTMHRRL